MYYTPNLFQLSKNFLKVLIDIYLKEKIFLVIKLFELEIKFSNSNKRVNFTDIFE
jgi:hypothetical protein